MHASRSADMLAIEAALNKHERDVAELLAKYPRSRKHIAYGVLGAALAVADSTGADAEGFIAHLRKRHPRPATTEKGEG